jgi:hypothetical protein
VLLGETNKVFRHLLTVASSQIEKGLDTDSMGSYRIMIGLRDIHGNGCYCHQYAFKVLSPYAVQQVRNLDALASDRVTVLPVNGLIRGRGVFERRRKMKSRA